MTFPISQAAYSRVTSSVLVTPPTIEPLTRAQGKLRAGLDWVDGDARDALMDAWIAAARSKVEQDTGLALLTQERDVYMDVGSYGALRLPAQCRPLQEVGGIVVTDIYGTETTVDEADYVVDAGRGRIELAYGARWSTAYYGRIALVVTVTAGWESAEALLAQAPLLVHAVGLLTAHYATYGRDVLSVGHIVAETPYGYEEAIAPHRLVEVV